MRGALAAALLMALGAARIGAAAVRQLVRERYTLGFVNGTPTIRMHLEPATRPPR